MYEKMFSNFSSQVCKKVKLKSCLIFVSFSQIRCLEAKAPKILIGL